MVFAKETKDLIKAERDALKSEIDRLQDVTVALGGGKCVKISFKLLLTVIDGKVLSALTGVASSLCCPICGAKPSAFNTLSNLDKSIFAPIDWALLHGLSPLHCWIRFLEFLLHLSYRLPFESWQIRSEFKKLAEERKKSIQNKLWKELALRVDFPRPNGSGTSNDGNTARRAFANYKQFANIPEVDEKLVYDLRTNLIAFGSQLPIDDFKFEAHYRQVLLHYASLYDWFKLPSSIHKVLVHGAEIIRTCSILVAMLGEEGAESRNKLYRKHRENHTRKMNRLVTMHDLFYRAIDSSDPIISNRTIATRQSLRKREPIPADVINLLCHSEVPIPCQASDDLEIHLDHEFSDILCDSILENSSFKIQFKFRFS